MLLVLFATLVITLALLGPTFDKIVRDSIRAKISMEASENPNLRFLPPDKLREYLDEQVRKEIHVQGLDEPWYSPKRFYNSVVKVMVLDLGRTGNFQSSLGSSSVKDIIIERLPRTVLLFTTATIIVSVIGLYVGAFVASKEGSVWDRMNLAFAVFSNSFPTWWIGMLMILLFAFLLNIFPAQSLPQTRPSDPYYIVDLLYHMSLPLLTLVLMGIGSWAYFVRYFVVGILGEDYIRAKRASGISEKKILYSHALKNAGPPIITSIALSLAVSFSGALLTESVFNWPGMGMLFYEAIGVLDIPIIIGLTYISTVIFIIAVFLTDLIYGYLDPRVRVSGEGFGGQ
jgi:peptide/nickel transport system permease protein